MRQELKNLQARQDKLLLKIKDMENDPELINPELFGLGADGRTVRPSPSARNRKAASYQNKLDKLEAKIEEADRNMIELSQESEKVLATMDWIESDIGVDEFMIREFRERLEVLRGTEKENAGIVWANIRKQLDESSSRVVFRICLKELLKLDKNIKTH
jgi:chromosome segregation ATPase